MFQVPIFIAVSDPEASQGLVKGLGRATQENSKAYDAATDGHFLAAAKHTWNAAGKLVDPLHDVAVAIPGAASWLLVDDEMLERFLKKGELPNREGFIRLVDGGMLGTGLKQVGVTPSTALGLTEQQAELEAYNKAFVKVMMTKYPDNRFTLAHYNAAVDEALNSVGVKEDADMIGGMTRRAFTEQTKLQEKNVRKLPEGANVMQVAQTLQPGEAYVKDGFIMAAMPAIAKMDEIRIAHDVQAEQRKRDAAKSAGAGTAGGDTEKPNWLSQMGAFTENNKTLLGLGGIGILAAGLATGAGVLLPVIGVGVAALAIGGGKISELAQATPEKTGSPVTVDATAPGVKVSMAAPERAPTYNAVNTFPTHGLPPQPANSGVERV